MREINQIIIHCSATPPAMDIGAARIREWHVRGNGWRDIGYHYVIRRSGIVEPGREPHIPGAHAVGYNSDSVGVCWVGGISDAGGKPEDNRTPEQTLALASLVSDLARRFPGVQVIGHRDLPGVSKACPCFDVKPWWASVQASTEQPRPAGTGRDVLPLVIADLQARTAEGVRKYGESLRANNGRDALLDAYQEALDLAQYLRQAIEERDSREGRA